MFADAIEAGRTSKGWSRRRLALAMGITPQYLQSAITGARPCNERLFVGAAQALGLKPWQLMRLGA